MKWINTKTVIDMATGAVEENDGFFTAAPIAEAKTGKSSEQKQADAATTTDLAKQGQLTDTAQGTLSQFEGPVNQSPFYKALLTSGTEATSNAYDNAAANVRQRANQAGFGYNQPVEQGAETGVRTAEAGALARLPGESMLQASGPALQAAGETAGMGMGYGQQGLGFNKNAGDMEARRGGIWNTLLQTGGKGFGDFATERWG